MTAMGNHRSLQLIDHTQFYTSLVLAAGGGVGGTGRRRLVGRRWRRLRSRDGYRRRRLGDRWRPSGVRRRYGRCPRRRVRCRALSVHLLETPAGNRPQRTDQRFAGSAAGALASSLAPQIRRSSAAFNTSSPVFSIGPTSTSDRGFLPSISHAVLRARRLVLKTRILVAPSCRYATYHTPISVGRFFDAGALYALRKPLKPIRESKQLLAAAEIEADLGGQPAQRPCALPVQGGSGFPSGQVVQHLADMPPTLERDRTTLVAPLSDRLSQHMSLRREVKVRRERVQRPRELAEASQNRPFGAESCDGTRA